MLVTKLLDINSWNTSQFAKWNNINFSRMLIGHLLYACVASCASERTGEIHDAEFLKCLPWCDFSFITYFKNYFTVKYFQTIFWGFYLGPEVAFLKQSTFGVIILLVLNENLEFKSLVFCLFAV